MSLIFLLAACGQREGEMVQKAPELEKEYRVHFTTGTVETKTVFGEAVEDAEGKVTYPAYWTANDRSVMVSLNYEQAVTAGVNADKTDEEGHVIRASFDASFTGIETADPYRFYLVSPATAFMWPSASREGLSFFVPGTQKPTAASIDEAAQILVARSEAYPAMPESEEVEVDFDHITSYGKLTLKNVAPGEGVSVESVTLWSEDQPIAGSWYYKFTDGSIAAKEPSYSLEVDTENIDIVAGDPVWFACAPAGLGGKPLKVAVNLSNGKALVRTVTLNSTVNFASGKIIRFSINMASAELVDRMMEVMTEEDVFQLVTSMNTLSVNDEVLLVDSASDPAHALRSGSISAVASGTGFTVGTDGKIRVPSGSSVAVMTVASKSGSSLVLKNGDRYLAYDNGSLSWGSAQTSWTASISNDGKATLNYRPSAIGFTRYYIRYANNTFSLNTSSSTVALYRKTTVSSSVSIDLSDAAVLQYDGFGAYLTDRVLAYNATTDQLSREYAGDGTLTFAILAPAEEQLVEFSGIPADASLGDGFSLEVVYTSGVTKELEAVYQVFVVKEEGPVLWLADGAGNGFIVKR